MSNSFCHCNIGLKLSKFCIVLVLANVIAITILATYLFSYHIFPSNPDDSDSNTSISALVPLVPDMEIQGSDSEEFAFVSVIEGNQRNFNESRGEFKFQILKHNFWLLKNYYRASNEQINLDRSITFATHADYSQLGNLLTLIQRWHGPVSVALYAPGEDFEPTLESLNYLLTCTQFSPKIHRLVTFHIYFNDGHVPNKTAKYIADAKQDPLHFHRIVCAAGAPYQHVERNKLYSSRNKLLYPINIGRNIAREAALTHFILEADINMYPNEDLDFETLEMAESQQQASRKVFTLPVFRIHLNAPLPTHKKELRSLIYNNLAFYKSEPDEFCYKCNEYPNLFEWLNSDETSVDIFSKIKRRGLNRNWEPYFIGTSDEPYHNERFSQEGGLDRSAQAYILCALDYDYYVLNDAFLVIYNKPSMVNNRNETTSQRDLANRTRRFLTLELFPQLKKIYGNDEGCFIH